MYLTDETGAPADTLLHKQFEEMDSSMGAFRSLQYVGIQTVHPPTDFKKIKSAIFKHIQDTAVRSPRSPSVVFQALKVGSLTNNRESPLQNCHFPVFIYLIYLLFEAKDSVDFQ